MLRFIKKRSNSRSTADKVVEEAEVCNKTNSCQSKDDEDSGYGEKQGLHYRSRMKSFSCEDLIAVASCSQDKRRQSAAANDIRRTNTKSTSSSASTSEEQIPQFPRQLRLCSVDIDGKGKCKLVKDDYIEAIYENESVKYRPKSNVHLKVF